MTTIGLPVQVFPKILHTLPEDIPSGRVEICHELSGVPLTRFTPSAVGGARPGDLSGRTQAIALYRRI